MARLAQSVKNHKLIIGGSLAAALMLSALFADVVAPYSYSEPTYADAGQFPSFKHLMGTDTLGRDLFSRVVFGTRVSLGIGIGVQALALLIGVSLGAAAGFRGGKADYIVTRLLDIAQAFPYLLLVILIMVTIGSGLPNVFLALSLTGWVDVCRLTRAQVLSLKEKEYVVAARSLGMSNIRVVCRHILPNAMGPIVVAETLGVPKVVFAEANLSFIGIGVNPPTPSWGKMVGEYYRYFQSYWHLSLFPVLMIGITMFSFILIGDGLSEALSPRGGAQSYWV